MCCVSSQKNHPSTHFLLDHYPSLRIHLLFEPTFSSGNIFYLAPFPQGHIYYQGNVFSPAHLLPEKHFLPSPISPRTHILPRECLFPQAHLLFKEPLLPNPYPLLGPISLGNVFSFTYILPFHSPSLRICLFPNHIPPSPMVLLIRIFTNFHEFLNSLKELMFVVNRGQCYHSPSLIQFKLMMVVKRIR